MNEKICILKSSHLKKFNACLDQSSNEFIIGNKNDCEKWFDINLNIILSIEHLVHHYF